MKKERSREGPSLNSETLSLYLVTLSLSLSLLRVEEAAGYLPAPLQKKKRHSHCKTTDTNEEDSYSSFGEDSLGSDNGGPPWNPPKDDQMDVDTSSPSQM